MVRKLQPPPVATPKTIEILLVDDHPIVRQGLTSLIEQEADLRVCGEAADADQALDLVRSLNPDIAIIDVSLKESNGLELVKQIKAEYAHLPMLVLSMHDEQMYAPRALKAGAKGYIMKQEAPTLLIDALRQILKNEIYLSSRMTSQMVSHAVSGQPMETLSPMDRLTDRELEVFEAIGRGLSTRQIADQLHRSVKTIEAHREHIKDKVGLKNAAELSRRAFQWIESAGIA
jgi:DNA-binding NarL/FixJ family response regulator